MWPASRVSLLASSKGARHKLGNGGGGRVSSYGVGGWGLWVPFGCDDNERWLRGGGRVAAVVRSGEKRPAFEGGLSEGDLVHFSFFPSFFL